MLLNGVHRWATCWKIERTDNTTYRFTDHDRPLFVDGEEYTPVGSPSASARQKTEGIGRAMNVEIRGVIDSNAISDDDLHAGRFRGARVTEFVVDWRFPWAGKFQVFVYWIRETTYDQETWTAQCEGLLCRMKNKVGQVLTRTCRHTLGDAMCRVNLAPFTVVDEVEVVIEDRVEFVAANITGDEEYYNGGNLTWITGQNMNIVSEVKSFKSNGIFRLQLMTPFPIAAGDRFSVVPGCDKNLTTCKNKFNNVVNFGGFPHLVGVDKQYSTTGAPV
jgi:uncharacterized phage protein (TIGR02218 family)